MKPYISMDVKSVFLIIFVCSNCVDLYNCIEWDTLVDRIYPKSCSKDSLLEKSRSGDAGEIVPLVSQAEVFSFVRQGQRLVKTLEEIDGSVGRSSFPSLAMQHFFTSQLSPEVKASSAASKANLLAARIILNKKTTCGNMTPNKFIEFLEANNFLGSPNRRFTMCKLNGANYQFRTLDGSCNNIGNPMWGAAKQPFTRIAPHNYCDGIYCMPISKSGRELPSARKISSRIMSGGTKLNNILTAMSVYWGQLVAHDLSMRVMEQHAAGGGIQCCSTDGTTLHTGNTFHPACAPINIAPDDPFYSQHNILYLNFVRSLTVPNGKNTLGPAEQMNSVSSYLDCSPVYGSEPGLSSQLREHYGGLMRITKSGYLPYTSNASALCDTSKGHCPCYLTGDSRVNQTPGLTALQTLLIREHNRIANILSKVNNHWDDERIYQEARRIVIAQTQHITYKEWLPLMLGRGYIKKYNISPSSLFTYDYDPNVNAGIVNSFATSAFRFFHTLIPDDVYIVPENNQTPITIKLSDQYMKPCMLEHYTKAVDGVLKGAVWQAALQADSSFSPEVRNLLFKSTSKWGLDLVALDIQRGRDHGLSSYNSVRSICGLKNVNSFEDLKNEITVERIAALKKIYDNVDDIDLFVGGLLESDVYGSVVGPTFQCILGEQFYRTRVGDRFFYDIGDQPHSFTSSQMREIKKSSMARLICNNCDIKRIPKYAFETLGNLNPELDCSNIPDIDINHWKEF